MGARPGAGSGVASLAGADSVEVAAKGAATTEEEAQEEPAAQ